MTTYFEEDGMNLNGKRNFNNTEKFYYNCGGYAFGIFSWLYPGLDWDRQNEIHDAMMDGDYDRALEISVEDLLKQFPEYKLILPHEIRNYPAKEYQIVAYRLNNLDFHFWKLGKNNRWYEKRGSGHRIYTHSFDEVWVPWPREDGITYDSKIAFFAKKRP